MLILLFCNQPIPDVVVGIYSMGVVIAFSGLLDTRKKQEVKTMELIAALVFLGVIVLVVGGVICL